MVYVRIKHKGEEVRVKESAWQATFAAMVTRLGAFEPGVTTITRESEEVTEVADAPAVPGYGAEKGAGRCDLCAMPLTDAGCITPGCKLAAKRGNSKFGAGKQVVDTAAAARLTALHGELNAAGAGIDTGKLLYATGTRMANVGYATQRDRAREHESKRPLADAVRELASIVEAEKRKDVQVSAADFGAHLTMNGKLKFDGYTVREQTIRGLFARLGSPALTYVLGLRSRITDEEATAANKAHDKAELLHVLQAECERFGKTPLVLRSRQGLGDVFACVSPEYAAADFPSVAPDALKAFPAGSKGTFSYDPTSTSWELRASVWTPTPVDEQAVGEPFEGFASLGGRDNGTQALWNGGGMLILACLNAGIYSADSTAGSRRHIGRILRDMPAMVKNATSAIRILTQAWGVARKEVIELPCDAKGKLIPIQEAIPGFYRMMLTSRRGELVGVLPGRTAAHVEGLARTFGEQRRDASQVVRADLANGYTRYIQMVPTAARRDAERAIGRWVVGREPVSYLAA